MTSTNAILAAAILAVVFTAGSSACAADNTKPKGPTMAEVLAESKPGDWRTLAPENTLYLALPTGRVIIQLSPAFAPQHVANVKALVRERNYDGLAIIRAQDNGATLALNFALDDPLAPVPELVRVDVASLESQVGVLRAARPLAKDDIIAVLILEGTQVSLPEQSDCQGYFAPP